MGLGDGTFDGAEEGSGVGSLVGGGVGLGDCLRATIGTAEDLDAAAGLLERWAEEAAA